jgi:glycosyltransferase involved in cell wall biosynthesis
MSERKRILVFRPILGEGGADRITITLLRYLDRARFQPTLVLLRREGIWLDDVPPDVPVVELDTGRLRYAVRPLASLLRRTRPDVLFSTSSGANKIAALAHRLVPDQKRRLVLSERNTFSVARQERRSKWLPVVAVVGALYRQADRIIAVSRGVADDLVQSLGLPADLVIPIHNPIVDESILELAQDPLDHPWFADDVPVLLAVGRLVKQKDYPLLLQAFALLRRRRALRLIVLGEGELRRQLERLANDLGVGSDVQFMGFVKNPFAYMQRCTIYVLSSSFEGLPGSLIQAMACGSAVVSTDCPSGPSEIIEDGSNGFLVPVGDVAQLAEAVNTLLDDSELRQTFSTRAREAAAYFEASSMVRRYEEALL